ncbi:MAG: RNA methyltransferase [Ilumatobacteraceae bacterium]|nr:RNA methyltransferase [Ilumatobacteraceae bacterium]
MLIAEAVAAGWEIEAEFVAPGADAVSAAPLFELADGVLERVATTERPQPNLAIARSRPGERAMLGADGTCDLVVVADRLSDPGNLGTMLRSAEASGVDAVVLTPGSVDPFNPKVVRASAGALFHVPVVEASLDEVRAAGLELIGTSSHQGERHVDADWSGRVALVLGNEAHGLADDADVDRWVRIEHRGRAESLNVAMAATVLVFEAARHRSESPESPAAPAC